MREYEIRILQAKGSPTLIAAEIHLTDESAVRSGKRMAQERPFEVWRDDERLYPAVSSSRSENPTDHPAT
jgi:hypothetical protein